MWEYLGNATITKHISSRGTKRRRDEEQIMRKITTNKQKTKTKKQKKQQKTPDVKPPTHKHRRMQQRNHLGTTTGAWGGGGRGRGSNIWNDRRTKNRNRGTALKWSVGNYLGWCGLYYFFFFFARNLTHNSDAAPNYIYIFGPHRGLLPHLWTSERHIFITTVMKQSKGLRGDQKPEHKKAPNRTTGIDSRTYKVTKFVNSLFFALPRKKKNI